MVLEKLSAVLKKTTDKIANAIFLDKSLVEAIVRDLQRALIEADVNVSLVLEISQKIKKEAYDERLKGVEKKEHLIKILHDELLKILGSYKEINIGKRNVFLLLGLYGQGKTTTISKLATYYAKRGNRVCTVGLDVHRPAAAEQLKQLSDKANIPCFVLPEEKNPKKIWKHFENEIKDYPFVFVDSAGRDALSSELIKEIKDISDMIKPTDVFLVMSADVGQTAKKQAQTFNEAVSITGVIITKMDSTAKAGGALTACAEVKAPVVFIGTGEKPGDIETFDPEAFLSRLLGMGDLKALMEKIQSVVDKDKIEEAQKRLQEGKFTLRDLQQQLGSMESLGSMDKLMSMIPGLGKANIPSEAVHEQQEKVKKWKHAINSMTQEEIENPELLEKETSRIQRVARGSGTTTSDIRMLIKQYNMLKEMVGSQNKVVEGGEIDQKTMMKLARKFGKKMRF